MLLVLEAINQCGHGQQRQGRDSADDRTSCDAGEIDAAAKTSAQALVQGSTDSDGERSACGREADLADLGVLHGDAHREAEQRHAVNDDEEDRRISRADQELVGVDHGNRKGEAKHGGDQNGLNEIELGVHRDLLLSKLRFRMRSAPAISPVLRQAFYAILYLCFILQSEGLCLGVSQYSLLVTVTSIP